MEKIEYICSCCGETHYEWPALAYISPHHYDVLSKEDKDRIAELTDDFCVIKRPDHTDRFIRVTLMQKVIDHCEYLEYGLWVSLSEKSFNDYSENFDKDHETSYFGWLSNYLPDYDFKESIPTDVHTQSGNRRPKIVPHEDFDHPFVRDYYNGITKQEAERRINAVLSAQ